MSRPNILFLMSDQHRADCLGLEGHPAVQTPTLDWIGASGFHFRHAYSACPVCVPARRTLMTGQKPASQGTVLNYSTVLRGPTLPGELSKAGYQTHLCGKKHLWPVRAHYGFDSMDWADTSMNRSNYTGDDYQRFLWREGVHLPRQSEAHGVGGNDWIARAWHMDEKYHFTNWTVDRAVDFLERRDPMCPFFLKVSLIHPHQPLTPPQFYYDRYINMDLPQPDVGDWARVFDGPQRGLRPTNSWRVAFDPIINQQIRAAYYGCVNHLSDQFNRLMERLPQNTIIVYCADHGEMLGDHQWLRKRNGFEASARIPFLIRFPDSMAIDQGRPIDEPVELMDLMPTLLDAASVPIPESVDGSSLMPLLRGESSQWREYLHGECAEIPTLDSGMQYVTDGKRKYIWFPGRGEELYFDLEADPTEMHNLALDKSRADEIDVWRQRLIDELTGRPEGFTDGRQLLKLDGPTSSFLPGFEAPPLKDIFV